MWQETRSSHVSIPALSCWLFFSAIAPLWRPWRDVVSTYFEVPPVSAHVAVSLRAPGARTAVVETLSYRGLVPCGRITEPACATPKSARLSTATPEFCTPRRSARSGLASSSGRPHGSCRDAILKRASPPAGGLLSRPAPPRSARLRARSPRILIDGKQLRWAGYANACKGCPASSASATARQLSAGALPCVFAAPPAMAGSASAFKMCVR